MKKIISKILPIILLISAILLSAASCFSAAVEDDRNLVKPDINTALENYNKLDVRRSQFDVKLIMKLYGVKTSDSASVTYDIGQQLFLDRILNKGSTFIDGKLNSYNVSENVTSLFNLVSKLSIDDLPAYLVNEITAYLTGRTHFTMNMGHREGSYNIKATHHDGRGISDPYWVATDDDSINAFISNNNLNLELKIADYLMFSTFLDLSKSSKIINMDNASKFFSTDTNLFNYEILAKTDVIYKMVFDEISRLAGFFNTEEYGEELQIYDSLLPYLKKWITIKNATVDASVNKDNYPTHMKTSFDVAFDFSIADLNNVVNILISKEEDRVKAKNMIAIVNTLLKDRRGSKSGEFSIDFQIIMEEKFLYGEENCSLSKVDSDLFLPTTVENAAREVYYVAKAAQNKGQEVDGNNGIKISDGKDD